MWKAWKVAVLLGLFVSSASSPAAAYCRTMSCELGEDKENDPCERDEHACVVEGNPVHWPSPCLTYAVQLDGSLNAELDGDQALSLVRQGFELWKGAECPGGGSPRFEATFQGFVSCRQRESVCGENVNVFMFIDSGWAGKSGELGVTTPAGGTRSGKLIDADVEFNSEFFDFRASQAYGDALFYVVAHEIGHFLGLSHSDVPGALMETGYQSLAPSEALLSPDDIAAICAAYPPGKPLGCAAPGLPAYDSCQLPARGSEPGCSIATAAEESGCSVAAGRAVGRGGAAPLGIVLLPLAAVLAVACRRRRAQRSPFSGS